MLTNARWTPLASEVPWMVMSLHGPASPQARPVPVTSVPDATSVISKKLPAIEKGCAHFPVTSPGATGFELEHPPATTATATASTDMTERIGTTFQSGGYVILA